MKVHTPNGVEAVLRIFADIQDVVTPNLLIKDGKHNKTRYTLITAGPRMDFNYSSGHLGVFEIAPVFLVSDGDLSNQNQVGLRIGFGYGIHLQGNQFALLKMDKVFQFDIAENTPSQLDVFNGAYLSLGWGRRF